jgi:hypothetical protein
VSGACRSLKFRLTWLIESHTMTKDNSVINNWLPDADHHLGDILAVFKNLSGHSPMKSCTGTVTTGKDDRYVPL